MSFNYLDNSISDEEFAKRFIAAFDESMKDAKPEDFEVNPEQLKKLEDLVAFFKKAAKDLGGKVVSVDLDPLMPPSGVTANFIVFDLFGDDIQRFCDVIRECSAISMDVTNKNEVSISCTIPAVFIEKTK